MGNFTDSQAAIGKHVSSHVAEFEQDYAASLSSDRYAIVQLSPRRWLVIEQVTLSKAIIGNGNIRYPQQYTVVETATNQWRACEVVAQRVKQDFKRELEKKGTALLDSMTVDQLSRLPMLAELGYTDYYALRVKEEG